MCDSITINRCFQLGENAEIVLNREAFKNLTSRYPNLQELTKFKTGNKGKKPKPITLEIENILSCCQ